MIFTSKRYPVRLSLSVSEETHAELKAIAKAAEAIGGAAVAAVARAAIEEGLPRVREAVKKQTGA